MHKTFFGGQRESRVGGHVVARPKYVAHTVGIRKLAKLITSIINVGLNYLSIPKLNHV